NQKPQTLELPATVIDKYGIQPVVVHFDRSATLIPPVKLLPLELVLPQTNEDDEKSWVHACAVVDPELCRSTSKYDVVARSRTENMLSNAHVVAHALVLFVVIPPCPSWIKQVDPAPVDVKQAAIAARDVAFEARATVADTTIPEINAEQMNAIFAFFMG